MPTAPALIGRLAELATGRRAEILTVDPVAPGYLELHLRADPPAGGWHPGHEVQFRVTPTEGRRYTVRAVGRSEPKHIHILAATEANGPGAVWLSRQRAGDATTILAGRHRPLRGIGPRRLYLGDGSALGTFDAYARDAENVVVIEARQVAVAALSARWPHFLFLPAGGTPGAATLTWLTEWLARTDVEVNSGTAGAVLLGHAQTIQHQRRLLLDSARFSRQAIVTRPYWADGRRGL